MKSGQSNKMVFPNVISCTIFVGPVEIMGIIINLRCNWKSTSFELFHATIGKQFTEELYDSVFTSTIFIDIIKCNYGFNYSWLNSLS